MKNFKILTLALAAVFAIAACNNGKQNQQQVETAEVQADSIEIPCDTVYEETFVEFAKEICGISIKLDENVWLPSYFKNEDHGFSASYYTKEDVDIDAMLDDFLGQCIKASTNHSIGIDPKCKTVAEAKKLLIEKQMKNESDPLEGYSYIGKIFYVAYGSKITANIIFTRGVGTNHVYYKFISE